MWLWCHDPRRSTSSVLADVRVWFLFILYTFSRVLPAENEENFLFVSDSAFYLRLSEISSWYCLFSRCSYSRVVPCMYCCRTDWVPWSEICWRGDVNRYIFCILFLAIQTKYWMACVFCFGRYCSRGAVKLFMFWKIVQQGAVKILCFGRCCGRGLLRDWCCLYVWETA